MKFIYRDTLSGSEKKEILDLWNNEYPSNLKYNSIDEFETYLDSVRDKFHVLIIDSEKKIVGWYFSFSRENKKWFAIIIASQLQGKGIGRKLLERAKQNEVELNGWVIDNNKYLKSNGDYYKTPLPFYLKNEFIEVTTERLEIDKISAVKIKWNNKT